MPREPVLNLERKSKQVKNERMRQEVYYTLEEGEISVHYLGPIL